MKRYIMLILSAFIFIGLGCEEAKKVVEQTKKAVKKSAASVAKVNKSVTKTVKSVSNIKKSVSGIGKSLGGVKLGGIGSGPKGGFGGFGGGRARETFSQTKLKHQSAKMLNKFQGIVHSKKIAYRTLAECFNDTTSDGIWQICSQDDGTNTTIFVTLITIDPSGYYADYETVKFTWKTRNSDDALIVSEFFAKFKNGDTVFYYQYDADGDGVIIKPSASNQKVRSWYQEQRPSAVDDYDVFLFDDFYTERVDADANGFDTFLDVGTDTAKTSYKNGDFQTTIVGDKDGDGSAFIPDKANSVEYVDEYKYAPPSGELSYLVSYKSTYGMTVTVPSIQLDPDDPTTKDFDWEKATYKNIQSSTVTEFQEENGKITKTTSTFTGEVNADWEPISGTQSETTTYGIDCNQYSAEEKDFIITEYKYTLSFGPPKTETETQTSCSGKIFTKTTTYTDNGFTWSEIWPDGTKIEGSMTGFTFDANANDYKGTGTYTQKTTYPAPSDPDINEVISEEQTSSMTIGEDGNFTSTSFTITVKYEDGTVETTSITTSIVGGKLTYIIDAPDGKGTFTVEEDTVRKVVITECKDWTLKTGDLVGQTSSMKSTEYQDGSIDFEFSQKRPDGKLIFSGEFKIQPNGAMIGTLKEFGEDGVTLVATYSIEIGPDGTGKMKNLATGEEFDIGG